MADRKISHNDAVEKVASDVNHSQRTFDRTGNLSYEKEDEEPELHLRTYLAFGVVLLLNYTQIIALQGPPAVLSYIGTNLDGTAYQTWVPNSLNLVQAALSPVISSASDAFQARKVLLVSSCVISFVGSAIAPGSKSIGRLIAAQTLIGVGFAAVPLAYIVPSEIVPRKWRPMAQGLLHVAACLAAISGPLTIGALVHHDPENGWRKFYWFQFALWGTTALGIQLGYKPPKRRTGLDELTFGQKLRHLDLTGFALLTAGLALLLAGLNLGGSLYPWTSGSVLGPLVSGIVFLVGFALYEWKGTRTGILHHELFQGGKTEGRTFALCVLLIFIEGIMLYNWVIFYPVLTLQLFDTDPLLIVAREQPYWIAAGIMSIVYGYISTKLLSIRVPMAVGYLIWTGATIGFACVNPDDSTLAIVMSGLSGMGFAAPLLLVIAGVHLSVPHHLIATATAVPSSARAVAATVFTAIYATAISDRSAKLVPVYVIDAAVRAGLPRTSSGRFLTAYLAENQAGLSGVPGVTPQVLSAAAVGMKHAMADSIRVVFIIAAPFGVLAIVACFFMGDLSKSMNYRVEAPVEDLHAKGSSHGKEDG